jgi:hypothetical protein
VHRPATTQLLGRHVAGRAEQRPRLGLHRHRAIDDVGFHGRQLGNAEVENLDASILRDEHVVRLEVAVDDATIVRGGQAAGDLDRVVHRLARP